MSNKKNTEKATSNLFLNGLIYVGLFGLLTLILCGVFGKSGSYVKNFILGVFGYASYGFAFGGVAFGIFYILGKRIKVSKGVVFLYFAAFVLIVAMAHIGTAKEFSNLNYANYLKECYLNHNTAGGALGAIVFFPFAKVYALGMTLFSLLFVGVVALLIVSQLKYELNFKSFGKKNSKKQSPQKVVMRKPIQDSKIETTEKDDRKLYNGTTDGKQFSDNIGRKIIGKPISYVPLENELNEKENQDENMVLGEDFLVNPKELDEKIISEKEKALKILYSEPQKGQNNWQNKTVNASEIKTKLQGENTSINLPNQPQQTPQETTSQPKSSQSLEYKAYCNNHRREQIEKNMDAQKMGNSFDNIKKNGETNNFLSEIEQAIQIKLDENFGANPIENINIKDSFDYSQPNIDNQTAFNPEPMESVNDMLNGQNKSLSEIERKVEEIKEEKMRAEREERRALLEEKKRELLAKRGFDISHSSEESKKGFTPQNSNNSLNFTNQNAISHTEKQTQKMVAHKISPYFPPDINCLRDYVESVDDDINIEEKIQIFESKMKSFGIDVKVINVVRGPRFSRLEFETSTELSRITAKTNDIAMWLEIPQMRMEAPIPGKSFCGIEIPNHKSGIVGLKAILRSPEFNNAKTSKGLYFALGKDIDGMCYVCDIAGFPHGLVAGASGTGKSVCLNSMLCSLLYKYSPQDLKLILIDPKVVEFNKYRGIPHLILPNIITEAQQVINALEWLVEEMETRYKKFADKDVGKISEYNAELVDGEEKMPYILLVVDEVGDLILSKSGKEFERLIKQLSAKARAAGIHLILATQRPSVDVITGTIKANLPTRIAFSVTSGVDSKTILDAYGAEKLLRMGDMLYSGENMSAPRRVQCAYIDNQEVKAVLNQVRERNESYYDEGLEEIIMKTKEEETLLPEKKQSSLPDELCIEVLEICLTYGNVSVSLLQRKLGLGYPRAAKLFDWLVDMHYVKIEGKNKVFVLSAEDIEQIRNREDCGEA